MSCKVGGWIFRVRNCWSEIINRKWTEICTPESRHSSLVFVEDAFNQIETNDESGVFISHFAGLRIIQGFNGSDTRRLVDVKRQLIPERIGKIRFGICSWKLERSDFYRLTGYLLESTDLINSGDPRVNFIASFGIEPDGYREFMFPDRR